jgi:SAM-dependent methyltransferase
MNCRHCNAPLLHTFLDLGFAPPSNAYLTKNDLNRPELYFPLRVLVCDRCWLVQTEDFAQAEALFTADYAYFSSTSSSWLAHAKRYSEDVITQLGLSSESYVVEIASNDGYLLKNFIAVGIPCLGIEPTTKTANAAERLGVPVLREFFGEKLARKLAEEGKQADLIIGNNVFAHVPDINDFTKGLKALLKGGGTITLEFPHLMRLIEGVQFDTVYHEHFSYLSLFTVSKIFARFGLRIWRVAELPTHGGSLRIYGCHETDSRATDASVDAVLKEESIRGLQSIETYANFQVYADQIKSDLLAFLIEQKREGKMVVAYGAAAKGNTLLNYAGVKPDLLPFVCDAAPSKQGRFLPGSHIPIVPPSVINEQNRPDFIFILPWNLIAEIKENYSWLSSSGTRFVTAVPCLELQ